MAASPPSDRQEQGRPVSGVSGPAPPPGITIQAAIALFVGVLTFLVVIMGHLWTTAYFGYFGLPASDLEFGVYEYAFRSLEVLLSVGLGALGFAAAWVSRPWLRKRGPKFAVCEYCVAALGLYWFFLLLWLLPVSFPAKFYATPGLLGLSAGLPLAAIAWFGVHLWQGPGDPAVWKPVTSHPFFSLAPLSWVVGRTPEEHFKRIKFAWALAGSLTLLAAPIAYPLLTIRSLGMKEAWADLATGSLPAAVLQAEGPLPPEIASHSDPTKSDAVRVVLRQSENIYVLDSTNCTTVGQLQLTTRVEEGEEFMPPEGPDVCKVFAIPTARLKSMEYVKVRGKAPANESRAHAVQVGLDEEFIESLSTKGALDEKDEDPEDRLCEDEDGRPRFYNSVWYAFEPKWDGTVLARAESADFEPVVGIWEEVEPPDTLKSAPRADGSVGPACDAVPAEHDPREPNVIETGARLLGGTRYVAAVASQENKGGDVRVSFEFHPAVVLSLSGTPEGPLGDLRVQEAILIALGESRIWDRLGYEGGVTFQSELYGAEARAKADADLEEVADDKPDLRRLLADVGWLDAALDELPDDELLFRGLLTAAGLWEGFTIQIQVEEEQHVIVAVAKLVQERLLAIGLDPSIEPCMDTCIRVYFPAAQEEPPSQQTPAAPAAQP